ncbi:protoporphyrinogen/coproporphyrinogen oxidase [Candidatus Omnitrophota bacterium]
MNEKRTMNCELAILGAGISGLTAAREAEKQGIDYILVEKSPIVGGWSKSMYIDDYVFDYTGHCLHLSHFGKPSDIGPFFRDEDWRQIERNSKCYYRGCLIDAPFQYNIGQLPEPLASKLYSSYVQARQNRSDENIDSFQEYLESSFGREMTFAFLTPYNEKLLATNLNRLSFNAVTRFFPPPVRENIEEGYKTTHADKKGSSLYNSTFWYPKRNGIHVLVEGLLSEVPKERILLSAEVTHVDLRTHSIETSSGVIKYGTLISSIPFKHFIDIIQLANNFTSMELSSLSASTVLCLNIGVRGRLARQFQGVHWIYFSEPDYPFYRIGFYSQFSEYMAPAGNYSIYVEIGTPHNASNLDTLVKKSLNCLSKLDIANTNSIDVLTINRIVDGYVHYTSKRKHVLEKSASLLADKSVSLIGRYGKWQYSSMEDSIREGIDAVRVMIKDGRICNDE